MEDSFIVGKKLHLTKSGGSEAGKPWTLKSGGGSSLGALQKFTPMYTAGQATHGVSRQVRHLLVNYCHWLPERQQSSLVYYQRTVATSSHVNPAQPHAPLMSSPASLRAKSTSSARRQRLQHQSPLTSVQSHRSVSSHLSPSKNSPRPVVISA